MTLVDLVAEVLEKGTYTNLDKLTRSEEFQGRLAERERLYQQLVSSDSDIAIALRAGHIEMGELLQTMPEYLALQQASQGVAPDPYIYELLEEVGERLVETAMFCLPKPILQVAEHIGRLNPDEQLKWIGLVYDGFQYAYDDAKKLPKKNSSGKDVIWTMESDSLGEVDVTQEDIDAIIDHCNQSGLPEYAELVVKTVQWVSEDLSDDPPEFFNDAANVILDYYENRRKQIFPWLYSVTEEEHPLERALPACYGVLGESRDTPTCFGMSIMLTAFARMTGLNVMLVSPIESADDLHKEYRGIDSATKLKHLDVAGFECGQYRDKLHATVKESADYQARIYDFHFSVAIQLGDGRWVHLDPYMRHYGLFDEDWELQRIFETLQKYQMVLPGLTLISSDGESLRRRLVGYIDVVKDAIDKAERVMQVIREKPYPAENIIEYCDDGYSQLDFNYMHDIAWIADILAVLEDTMELTEQYLDQFGTDIKPVDTIRLIEFFFEDALLGFPRIDISCDEETYIDRLQSYWYLFEFDADFKRDRITDLILGFLRIVINRWNALMEEIEHSLLDPAMQFSMPEYNIALTAVNHARCWTDNDVSGKVLLKLSSSQFFWHDAVDLSTGYQQSDADDQDVLEAEVMLQTLPRLHRACMNKLEYLSQLRETQPTREE